MSVDPSALPAWYREYVDVFAACARGEANATALAGYYAVPTIITSDDGVINLTTDDQVAAVLQGQVDGLRAQGYHATEIVNFEAAGLNSSSATIRVALSRRDAAGHELNAPTITYVVTDHGDGPRFSVLAAHA